MNFLAHIYLSGSDEQIRLGNFSGDYVKGSNFSSFPPKVVLGLKLHRTIDSLTDSHPGFFKSRNRLIPIYGRYAGVVVDMFYDHVLASNWENYCAIPLLPFSKSFYFSMVKNYHLLPRQVKYFLPFMIQSSRLYSYASLKGIGESLDIMSRRTSLPDRTTQAIALLEQDYEGFNSDFKEVFPYLMQQVEEQYGIKTGCGLP
ncbi:MAG TPA: ACP phosphodiesterase [Williamwhitmania sp.]|nr:ACP phosphodiesterase [Williamwhitmania sp.]